MKYIKTTSNPRIRMLMEIKEQSSGTKEQSATNLSGTSRVLGDEITTKGSESGINKAGLYLVYGDEQIQREKEAGTIEFMIADHELGTDNRDDILTYHKILMKLCDDDQTVHQIAVCRKRDIAAARRILLLDGVADAGNIGTLVRTACSFSFDAVYYQRGKCDLYCEQSLNAAKGAITQIPVIGAEIPEVVTKLQEQGVYVVATRLEKSKTFDEIPAKDKMAFVMGNEAVGVSKPVQDMADECLRIEMDGFESLNVGVAGGIVMHHYRGGKTKN